MFKPETFEQLLEEGVARVQLADTHADKIESMRKRARGLPFLVSRRMREWDHVRRATFFEHPVGGLRIALLSAIDWVPEAVGFSSELRDATNRYADENNIPKLKTPFTNIGIHWMSGWPDSPAHIPDHIDVPEEKGYVAVFAVDGEDAGMLTMLACQDLCADRNIEQVVHGATAIDPRISYTFANLQK